MSESAESLFNPELQITSDLLRRMHVHKLDAMQLQNDLDDAHARALQPTRITNYLTYFRKELPQIPARHHRLIFGPQYGAKPYEGVNRLIVRFPDTTDDFYPEAMPGQGWSDVFIEAIDDKGNRQNYLLNNKGFMPFDTAETDIIEDMDFEITGDLFSVHQASTTVQVPIDVFSLSYLVSDLNKEDSYIYQLQTKDIDPPIIEA